MSKLYISMYHYTRDLKHSRYPGIKGLDYDLFEQQLQFFRENFHVVTMEEVLNALEGGPLPDRPVLLTFDDGYIDNYTAAFPLLQKYGLQGSFFIPGKTFDGNRLLDVNKIHFILATAPEGELKGEMLRLLDERRGSYPELPPNEELYLKHAVATRMDTADVIFVKRMLQTVLPEGLRSEIASLLFQKYVGISEPDFARELYMNRDQIRCMKRNGMFIGLHGYDHYWLADLPEEQMHEDVDRALEVMDEFIDSGGWIMNYPYGNYNENVVEYVKGRGCILGLTTEVRVADLSSDDRYRMPRFDCNDFPPKSDNYKKNSCKKHN